MHAVGFQFRRAAAQNSILQRIEFSRTTLYVAYYDSPTGKCTSSVPVDGNRNRYSAHGRISQQVPKRGSGCDFGNAHPLHSIMTGNTYHSS